MVNWLHWRFFLNLALDDQPISRIIRQGVVSVNDHDHDGSAWNNTQLTLGGKLLVQIGIEGKIHRLIGTFYFHPILTVYHDLYYGHRGE